MKQMALCFLRLMEIISSKQNCNWHMEGLRNLIINFEKLYCIAEDGIMKREAYILVYILHLKFAEINGKKLE